MDPLIIESSSAHISDLDHIDCHKSLASSAVRLTSGLTNRMSHDHNYIRTQSVVWTKCINSTEEFVSLTPRFNSLETRLGIAVRQFPGSHVCHVFAGRNQKFWSAKIRCVLDRLIAWSSLLKLDFLQVKGQIEAACSWSGYFVFTLALSPGPSQKWEKGLVTLVNFPCLLC